LAITYLDSEIGSFIITCAILTIVSFKKLRFFAANIFSYDSSSRY